MFLQRLHLPHKHLYYDLDKDDKRLTQEIRTGINYQLLTNDEDITLQALIPLNNELQIHIYKIKKYISLKLFQLLALQKLLDLV